MGQELGCRLNEPEFILGRFAPTPVAVPNQRRLQKVSHFLPVVPLFGNLRGSCSTLELFPTAIT